MVGIQIGKDARVRSDELVDLLLDCHQRIRQFVALAVRLAGSEGASAEEVCDAARSIRRYFAEALPLHVVDEEESISPRLRGLNPTVDQALEAMRDEHGEHEALIAELVSLCHELENQPERLGERRARLADLGETLGEQFGSHLEREEKIIFPQLAELSEHCRGDIISELRARRTVER